MAAIINALGIVLG